MASDLEEEQNNIEKIPMREEIFEADHTPSNADDMMPQKPRKSMKDIMSDFTQHTTFHGVRLLFLDNVGIVRKVIWFIVFVACTVLMGVQIISRIIYYYSYPVTVNVDISFNRMMDFPTLTLCNQNNFRATAASQRGWYQLVEYYSKNTKLDKDALEAYNASFLSLDEFYLSTAHRKDDFIVACEWQNEICGPENFTEVPTDHGVCYTFNDNRGHSLVTTSTGSGSGLRLTLNVEQYEYMPGAHSAAGIKMLLHDHKEFPRVGELGVAVPTGSHAFVGIQLLRLKNLPAPHSSCMSRGSRFYERYSPDACQLTCMTTYLDELCGCRHIYLPHDQGSPAVCSMEQYMTYMMGAMVSAKEHVRDNCKCPPPCDSRIYDPTVSFASMSKYATENLLAAASRGSLYGKYLQARETTSRMDNIKFQNFTILTKDVTTSFRDLQNVINKGLQTGLQNQRNILASIKERMETVWKKKNYLLQWQKYHLEENFVKAKEDMEERAMSNLALGCQEFSFQVESRISQIAHGAVNLTLTDDVKMALYIDVLNLLDGRKKLADKAYENYTQLYNAYFYGEPIFNHGFQDEPVEANEYITPRALLNDSLFYSDNAENDTMIFGEDILALKDALDDYISLAKKSYFDNTADPQDIEEVRVQFLLRSSQFSQSKTIFYTETVEYPLKVIVEKLEQCNQRWKDFERDLKFMLDNLEFLLSALANLHKITLNSLQQKISVAQMYIDVHNVTKMNTAATLTSDQLHKAMGDLENFFREIRSRGQQVHDGWSALNLSTNAIWATVLDDENMEEYYRYQNMSEFLEPYAQISQQVARNYTRSRDGNNFLFVLGHLDTSFLRNLEKLVAEMKDFSRGAVLDTEFVKNNFLRLDVFYKEKGYQQISQQVAYGVFDLLCDIGASMAFYLGASILTVCELFDLGLHHFIYRLTHHESI